MLNVDSGGPAQEGSEDKNSTKTWAGGHSGSVLAKTQAAS